MRGRTLVAACVLMTLCLATLPAQDAFVVYLEGVVEYRDGAGWVESFVGDAIPAGTEIRVGDGGFLEVVAGDRTVRYTKSGTYRM
nr:hypothetical protein [Spirochaeta sp.]